MKALGPGKLFRRALPRGGASWTLDYTDGRGRRRRVVLGSDKRVAERRRADIIRQRDLELAGLGSEEGQSMPLAEVRDLYLSDLRHHVSRKHLVNVELRLRKLLEGLDAVRVRDVTPHSVMIALLAHPCPGESCLHGAGSEDGPEGLRWAGEFGELLVDRVTGLPIRLASAGDDPIRISWLDWGDHSGTPWPRRFRLERSGGRSLDVAFGRVQLGRAVPSSRFRPETDPSREILNPAEAAALWVSN